MKTCAYCGEHATAVIPAIPDRVCMTHAQEFWTGLLTYAKRQAQPTEPPKLRLVAQPFTERTGREWSTARR